MNNMLLSQEINKNTNMLMNSIDLPIQVDLNKLCDKYLSRISHLQNLIEKEEEKLFTFMHLMSINKKNITIA